MPDMKIYTHQKHQDEHIPMDEVRRTFQEWFDRGALEDCEARISHGFLSQADFVGSAKNVATSDEHIMLTATLFRVRSKGPEAPHVMVRQEDAPFCELIALFPKV